MMTDSKTLITLAFFIDKTGEITDSFLSPKSLGSMASARIQVIPALTSAKTLGIQSKVISLDSANPEDFFELGNAEYCLLGKMSANTIEKARQMIVANLAAVFRLKNKGCKIITLYCDNLFHPNNILSDFYSDIFCISDHIVFPCEALRETTLQYVKPRTTTHIIHDPWQISKQYTPRELGKEQIIKLIWFGSNKNIDYLLRALPDILSNCDSSRTYELTILATKFSFNKLHKLIEKLKPNHKNWYLRLVEWNIKDQPRQLESEITRAHISFIPSDPTDPLKAGVSHNRLVDSLRGGCITVASPLQSYEELSELCLLGNNFSSLINKAIQDYENYCSRLTSKSKNLLIKFSPESNSKAWLNFWNNL